MSQFNLPNMTTDESVSMQTRQNLESHNDFFDRRPDLENVLLDALETSMSDYLRDMPHSSSKPHGVLKRETLKSQITEVIKKQER